MKTNGQLILLCNLVFLAALPGCNRSQDKQVDVTGTVVFADAPIEGATVLFQPTAGTGGMAIQAVTAAEGRFEIGGLAPGDYRVSVTKLDTSAVSSTLTPPKHSLPAKYASPLGSGLTAVVAVDGENDFTFELQNGSD